MRVTNLNRRRLLVITGDLQSQSHTLMYQIVNFKLRHAYKREKFAREFQRQFKKMARAYKKRRFYRRKGRWSVNIKDINDTQTLTYNNGNPNGNSIDLCLNPVQDSITVSQQYTVKNIELSVFMESINNNFNGEAGGVEIEDIQHYIMYVPQGMNLTTDYNLEHPEYIMAYYYQGNPTVDGYGTQAAPGSSLGYKLKIKTRMARRLQTGDRIIYFWKARNTDPQNTFNVRVGGLVRWWTKAN